MFKVKHNLCPEIMQSFFFPKIPKGLSTVDFHVNSVYNGEHSIRSFRPLVWNTMEPESIKNISNPNEFKKSITAWVYTR